MPPPVYVLVGGKSERFGTDKATYEVDGEPWALHVGRRLAASDAEITLVGSLADPGPLAGIRRIKDSKRCCGPLAGVLAALEDRRHGLLTLASCDLVRPETDWLAPLLAAHATNNQLDAAVYRAADRWQPFPSVVHSHWQEWLGELVESGVGSLQAALSEANAAGVPWTGQEAGPPQANTPERLGAILRD